MDQGALPGPELATFEKGLPGGEGRQRHGRGLDVAWPSASAPGDRPGGGVLGVGLLREADHAVDPSPRAKSVTLAQGVHHARRRSQDRGPRPVLRSQALATDLDVDR
jgi:hypothetical protein